MKDVSAKESFRPQKKTFSTSKQEISSLFLYSWVIFGPPWSGSASTTLLLLEFLFKSRELFPEILSLFRTGTKQKDAGSGPMIEMQAKGRQGT
jgi:hypothetical protein